MKKPFVILTAIVASAAIAVVMGPVDSMRDAIEFTWIQPTRTFMVGEPVCFEVIAENIAPDSALVVELDPATIRLDGDQPFVLVRHAEPKLEDTLATGAKTRYRYILTEGPNSLYDPFREVRSYATDVGLSCLPAGEYRLIYRKRWSIADSIDFKIVEPPATERALLDTLAEMAVAYQVGRLEDAAALGFRLFEMSSGSPYTARGLIFARGAAWEKGLCDEALKLDSLFWESFGEPAIRSNFLPYPGLLRATAGIWGKCTSKTERLNRLDRLAAKFDDPEISAEIDHYRRVFEGKAQCSTCPK